MRILHTADWHLGKMLEGRDRQAEQEQFIDEICMIAVDERTDIVLIAGDVFQTANPSAAAEDLFFDAINRLDDHGRRGVVVLAGNHDNAERLMAPTPLAERLGITLVGLPASVLSVSSPGREGVRRVAAGPSWLELAVPDTDHSAVIVALPYPSEGRLKKMLASSLDEQEGRVGYNEYLTEVLGSLKQNFRPDTVNILSSHIYVTGAKGTAPEMDAPVQMGGAYSVAPSTLDIGAQYVALGHLHRPQEVRGCGAPAHYAGSPLSYSFAESGQVKSVIVAEIFPGKEAAVRRLPLSTSRPLICWQARGGLPEVHRWIEEGLDASAWIDLEIHASQLLPAREIQALRELRPNIVGIRIINQAQGGADAASQSIRGLSVEEMFRRFFAARTNGLQPDEAMVSLFLALTQEMETERGPMSDETSQS